MNKRSRHSRISGSWLAIAGAAGLVWAGTALAADPGAWQSHQVTFHYLGSSPVYSCEGLRGRLSYLLTESGARLDGPVLPSSCTRGFGRPTVLPSVRLKFSVLKPVDASGAGAASSVSGMWRQITFQPQTSDFNLRGPDCELVQEFRDKILPMLAVRNVKSRLNCIPHQGIGNQFMLSFEAFVPAGKK